MHSSLRVLGVASRERTDGEGQAQVCSAATMDQNSETSWDGWGVWSERSDCPRMTPQWESLVLSPLGQQQTGRKVAYACRRGPELLQLGQPPLRGKGL